MNYKKYIQQYLINLAKNKRTTTYKDFNNYIESFSNKSLSLFDANLKTETYYFIEEVCRDLKWNENINLSWLILTKDWIQWSWYFEVMKNRWILENLPFEMTIQQKKEFHKKDLQRIFNKYQ